MADEKEVHSRKERKSGSTHYGDTDFNEETPDQIADATWAEVFTSCCVHDAKGWGLIFLGICGILFFLYFFLLGLELLGSSAKVIGGCTAGALFGDDQNPVAGLMIGILATVLLQSSSTTTSIVVSLVGAESVSVKAGIYMIMGANIGTSVTNTIVAMGQMGDGDQLERAFAGATVHDMFNFLSVAILFPIELVTHYLYAFTKVMLPDSMGEKGDKWEGPLKKIVSPLGKRIIHANKDVTKEISQKKKVCADYYPVYCEGGIETKKTCTKVGLIKCDGDLGCPAFFADGATEEDDKVSGGVCLFLSLVLLIICLIGLITILQKMLLGMSTRIINKAVNMNGYIAILIGAGITVLVQSSSITTSTLTPLVGMGVIPLEQMLPLTLGANIGTTFTGLMSALVSSKIEALQVALCHLFFNISGIIIWYPIPFMRRVPLNAARALGRATRTFGKLFPIVYIVVVFVLIPLALFGISALFEQKTVGFVVLGSFLVIFLVLLIAYLAFKWYFRNGRENCIEYINHRSQVKAAVNTLPNNMNEVMEELVRLKEHTGLPDKEPEKEEIDEEKGAAIDA
eukprot:CAMPEP_0184857128 /NCGR_PEP_ID=MMETSP0580-20130426/2291_1 /TAXON_ID=1118495 /ORGANISM="Dactyliosolen fragilissimus" /LENGTH=569 /DNA_ID=CAMNT_0027352541 /DNA_START=45 /DNA_END=1754 /DNA_ORIENTATION=-